MDTVSDWLTLHGVDHHLVLDAIIAIESGSVDVSVPISIPDWDSDSRSDVLDFRSKSVEWCLHELVLPAIHKALELDRDQAARASDIEVRALRESAYDLPCTENKGPSQRPVISIDWGGSAADLVCLSHEAAHAVQINLSGRTVAAPMLQEMCAFVGELAILERSQAYRGEFPEAVRCVWTDENNRYFGEDLRALKEQCQHPGNPYYYRMNYPLARVCALQGFRESDRAHLRGMFTHPDVRQLHSRIAGLSDLSDKANNRLPQLLPAAKREAYRSLGIMATLDACYSDGECDLPIGEYYAARRTSLEQNTALISVAKHRKPIGYVNWMRSFSDGDELLLITRQSAPFGDHLALLSHFEQYVESAGAEVSSQHARSAREVQQAW